MFDLPTIRRRDALAILGYSAFRAAAFAQTAPKFPKNAIIRTILKDMKPEELAGGATLFHEHMSFAADFMPRWMQYNRAIQQARGGNTGRAAAPRANPPATPAPAAPYFMDDLDLMVDEMKAAKADGIACIVDGGHEDMGRKIENLKILSERSGLPIVAGGGLYAQPFYPPEVATMSEEQITKMIVDRCKKMPIGALGEIGTWDEMTPDEKKVFRAVGKAHLETNLPIFTHTAFGKGAVEQLDVFESVGVKPSVCLHRTRGRVARRRSRDPERNLQARRVRRL